MTRIVLFLPLLLAAAALASLAQEPGRYRVEGSEPGWGAFRGEVQLERSGGRLRYAGGIRWSDGRAGVLRGSVFPGAAGALVSEELLRGNRAALGARPSARRRVGQLPRLLSGRAVLRYALPGQSATWRQLTRMARVRVMSFNILGFKADWIARSGRVAAAIRAANPDLVCLQEVVGVTRGRSPQANGLGRRAGGYRVRFEGFRKYSWVGPWMGNAVLSRWPVQEVKRAPLPRGPSSLGAYPRGVTWIRVSHPSGAVLDVGSLHLHQRHAAADRQLRLEQTRAAMRSGVGPGAGLRLLVGDYNATPSSATYAALRGAGWRDLWREARPGDPGYTASVLGQGQPKRIDFVFSQSTRATVRATGGALSGPRTRGDQGDLVSDHRALLIELTAEVPLTP